MDFFLVCSSISCELAEDGKAPKESSLLGDRGGNCELLFGLPLLLPKWGTFSLVFNIL